MIQRGRLPIFFIFIWHLCVSGVLAAAPLEAENPQGWRLWQKVTEMAGAGYREWEGAREKLLPEVVALADRLIHEGEEQKKSLGDEAFLKKIDLNQVDLDVPEGRAALTLVDRAPIARVVHPKSEVSFLVIDTNDISPDSRHLKRLIGLQHFDSGRSRHNGKVGRDVVIVWRNGKEIVDSVYISKPWMFSPRWWDEYIATVVRKPSRAHIGLGTACAIAQTGLALCVAATKQWLDPGSDFEYEPAILSAAFGLTMGINVKTYKTWCLIGPKISQIAKSSMVSLAFAYSLISWTDGMANWDWMDTAFWLAQFHILSNAFFNNWAKIEWHQINKVREQNRLNTRPFHLYKPGTGWVETGVSWSDIEHQSVYLIPFTLRLGDLTKVSIPFEKVNELMPGMESLFGDGLPLGKALLYASIPAAQYLVLKYAEHNELEGASRLRNRYERAKKKARFWLLNVPISSLHGLARMLGVDADENQSRQAFDYAKYKIQACIEKLVAPGRPPNDSGGIASHGLPLKP